VILETGVDMSTGCATITYRILSLMSHNGHRATLIGLIVASLWAHADAQSIVTLHKLTVCGRNTLATCKAESPYLVTLRVL
jgi:hypothetical protein